jgi:hypothetical protein
VTFPTTTPPRRSPDGGVIAHEPGRRDSEQPTATRAPTVPTIELAPTREPYPLLVAPATVGSGEEVSIVAYQRRDLCGSIELRLDGRRLDHRVTATIEAPQPDWDSVLLTVRIPAMSGRDAHELELVGPVPGRGRGGPRCGDREQRWGRIATASVVVEPPAG